MVTMSFSESKVRDAAAKDLHKLADLIHYETHIHRHLDYCPPLDWLGKEPFLVLEKNKSITAALACPPDPEHVAWIRLFAAVTRSQIGEAWKLLWEEAKTRLRETDGLLWAAALPMQHWFEALLVESGFEAVHSIVMLGWDGGGLPDAAPKVDILIRPMSLDDLQAVQQVDQAAFPPIWQHSLNYLELAFRQAAIATVAERDGQIVGYQVSTTTTIGGHLARLAVVPELQGRGIGRALLYDLLLHFARRGARTVTVNTQKNNTASLALYKRMGFVLTSEEYPTYQYNLAPNHDPRGKP